MIILVYLCMGLQVVSIDIPVVKESEMASSITFYRNDNPQKIAEAVLNSAHNEANSERLIGNIGACQCVHEGRFR